MNSRNPRREEIDALFRLAFRPCREIAPPSNWEAIEQALPAKALGSRALTLPLLRLRAILEWLFIQPTMPACGTHVDILNRQFLAVRMIA